MSDREEETKSGVSTPPLPHFEEGTTITMNLHLQEAVYALMAEANLLKRSPYEEGESSRSTLPPVRDSALKGPFDDILGVDGSEEDERPRNAQDHTPKVATVQDIQENKERDREKPRIEQEEDSPENEEKMKDDNQRPRIEKASTFDSTGGVDDSDKNDEKKKEDQGQRRETEQDSWGNKIKKEVEKPSNEAENPDELVLMSVSDVEGVSRGNTEDEIEDQRPRNELEQGTFENEVSEPRIEPAEADAYALMLLSGVAREIGFWMNLCSPGSSVNRPPSNHNDDVDDDSQENLENSEDDQRLRSEIANWYAKKMYNKFNEEMSSLTDVMKAFESYKMQKQDSGRQVERTLNYVDENEQMESDYADKILGIDHDVNSHLAEEKTEESPAKDSNEPWTHLNTEIAILESIINYKAKKGGYPFTHNINDLADFIKNWLRVDVPVGEFSDLIQFLRHKYAKRAGKKPVNADTPKTKEEKVLELAFKIWG